MTWEALFPGDLSLAAKGVILLNHLTLELLFYSTLALALSRPTAARAYGAAKPILDRISAAALSALGLRLILDRNGA